MGWFSGLGHDLSKLVGSIDKVASGPVFDPLKGVTQNITADIFGKNSAPTRLYDKITNHPAEAAAAAAAAYYGGEALYGAGAGGAAGAGLGGAGDAAGLGVADTAALGGAADTAAGLGVADTALLGGTADTAAGLGAADASFLPVTGAGAADGTAALTPELQSMLGISPGGAGDLLAGGGGVDSPAFQAGELVGSGLDGSAPATASGFGGVGTDPSVMSPGDLGTSGSGGVLDSLKSWGGDVASWAKTHPLQAASLAMTAKNLLGGNQLPSSARTAQGASTAAVQQASGVLASGGVSSPQWATMKGSIDSGINAKVAEAIEAAKQAAANSGMGDTNSAVVQQQINKIKTDAETQRQQLYSQALQGIVSQAMTELSGGDQTLTNIANMQISQSKEAQTAAALTAQLAAQLSSLTKTPSSTGGP